MENKGDNSGLATKLIHAGETPCPRTGAMMTPVYQTTSYLFKDVQDGARKCEHIDHGYCYTRLGNPTQSALEEKLARLEEGEAALAFASGVAAISSLLFSHFKQGDHAIVDSTCYGATHYLFDHLLKKFGVEITFIDTSNHHNIEEAILPQTRMIYVESPANPTLKMVDMDKVAEIGRRNNILTAIDSTYATPYLQQPLKHGIDVVIHSTTKFLCGHGDAIGGALIGSKELMDHIRDDTLKNMGGIIAPWNAYLLIRGIKTLDIRMDKHCANAMAVACFLEEHPQIKRVFYPGLTTHPQHELAERQMNNFGGMICFELKGGLKAGESLLNNLKLCSLAVSLGHAETLIEHPASMTHWYVDKKDREKAGISDGLIRMSVGLEDPKDIIQDLEQALYQIKD